MKSININEYHYLFTYFKNKLYENNFNYTEIMIYKINIF